MYHAMTVLEGSLVTMLGSRNDCVHTLTLYRFTGVSIHSITTGQNCRPEGQKHNKQH